MRRRSAHPDALKNKVDVIDRRRARLRVTGWAAIGAGATAGLTVATMISPLVPVFVVALAAFVFLALRYGLLATLLLSGLVATALSALVARYVPAAGVLNSVGTALIVLVGLVMLPRARVPRVVTVPGLLFLALATLSMLFAVPSSPEYALRGWVALVTAPLAVVGTLGVAQAVAKNRSSAVSAIWSTVIGLTVLNILLGFKQALLGLDAAETRSATEGESTYKVGEQIRLMGGFLSNQDMGLFLACLAPAFLVLALGSRGRRQRWLCVLSGLLYVVNFLSLTRTSLIAGVLAGVVALFVWGAGDVVLRVMKNVLVVAGGVGLGALVLSSLNIARVNDAVARAATLFDLSEDGSFNSRQNSTLPIAWAKFLVNPLGSGVGSSGPVSQQFPGTAPFGYTNADNGYLNIAIQLGIQGFIVFVVLLVAVIALLGRRGAGVMANAASAAALALAIAMLTAGYWSLLAPMSLIGVFVGLGLAARSPKPALYLAARTELPAVNRA